MTFSDLNLTQPILKAIDEVGYKNPSPIQQQAIGPVLNGNDLLGCAQTGTGKTAAFAIPILQRLCAEKVGNKRAIRALILTPTRELALQIHENFVAYGKYLNLRCTVIFGGVNQNPQVEQLKNGVDILTATPGRLNDLVGQGFIDLSKVNVFVLDEADRMLDMGFVNDVKKVIRQLPSKRQTLLFSATMPSEIEQLANSMLKNPTKVMVAPPSTTVEKIQQSVYFVDKANKRHLLVNLLSNKDIVSALIFTRTKHGADKVVRDLTRVKIKAMAIHGNKSQNARQDALAKFKDGGIRVLVATDIAARGIDVSGLSHVFNYDLPNIPETYVHRIGRTGRAGKAGIAVSFCDFEEKEYLDDIEKLAKIKIPVVENHKWPMQVLEVVPKQPRQPRKSKIDRTDKQQNNSARLKKEKIKNREELKMENKAEKNMPEQKQGTSAQNGERKANNNRHKNSRRNNNKTANAQENNGPKNRSNKRPNNKKQEQQPKHNMAAQEKSVQQKSDKKPQSNSDDAGIQLITRRAPVQKFASFEDYMKARTAQESDK